MEKQVTNINDNGVLTYITNFISEPDANKLFDELKEKVPWHQGSYNMFGKTVKTPRMLYAMRDKNIDITKSYKVTDSMEWLPSMKLLKEQIEKETGKTIKYAQLNYYRDGNDYIGFHTDSEVQDGDIIASISLGSARKFVLRHKKYKENGIKPVEYTLNNGSLLIMNDSAAKHHWKHSLPKDKKGAHCKGRINITFRPR